MTTNTNNTNGDSDLPSFDIPSLIPPLASSSTSSSNHLEHHRSSKASRLAAPALSSKENNSHKASPSLSHKKSSSSSSRALQASSGLRTPQTTSKSSSSVSRSSTRGGSSAGRRPPLTSRAPLVTSSSSSATKAQQQQPPRRSVLRFGETVQVLFCVTPQSRPEHVQLAHQISQEDSAQADDPHAWYQALQYASWTPQLQSSPNNEVQGTDLIRLHRRATLRFPLSDATSSPDDDTVVWKIWWSFCELHVRLHQMDEARRTYKYMFHQLSSSAVPVLPKYYIQASEWEVQHGDPSAARDLLQKALLEDTRAANDREQLQAALDKLTGSSGSRGESQKAAAEIATTSSQGGENMEEESSNRISPKRQKTESGFISRGVLGEPQQGDDSSKMAATKKENVVPLRPAVSATSRSTLTTTSSKPPPPATVTLASNATLKTTTSAATAGKPPTSSRPRPTSSRLLLSSRLGPKGLSGKAKRVEPEKSMEMEDSESELESQCENASMHIGGSTTTTAASPSTNPAPKIKKLDLSYMWEWDPTARTGKTEELQPPPRITTKEPTALEKTLSSSSGGGATTTTNNATATSHRSHESSTTTGTATTSSTMASSVSSGCKSTASIHNHSHKHHNSTAKSSSSQMEEESLSTPQEEHAPEQRAEESPLDSSSQQQQPPHPPEHHQQVLVEQPRRNSSSSPPQEDPLANINREFLPLVHENNIVRVNGSAYAKLGVIGKGGSCKVYRALSKKCSVVAVKKVKLEGMDKKAIEGYANEISLLKRLRGNPAIIQMYDAEVDLNRKSIFVVMELGEADLNHILQQRALSGQQKKSRSLNMNFIRLTWQQMLSAVHSIHEERIIHSDLKPANFLFVRGALKLIDFGIAKAIQSDDTTNIYRESHIGTLNYMSPEAILDTETGSNGPRMRIGRASDVWSLGCILYEMVHGKTPFAKLHFIQKLQAIVNPNHSIEISGDVDEAAADAIRQCLQRNPEDRPPIVGPGGLLNEHLFLHSSKKSNHPTSTS